VFALLYGNLEIGDLNFLSNVGIVACKTTETEVLPPDWIVSRRTVLGVYRLVSSFPTRIIEEGSGTPDSIGLSFHSVFRSQVGIVAPYLHHIARVNSESSFDWLNVVPEAIFRLINLQASDHEWPLREDSDSPSISVRADTHVLLWLGTSRVIVQSLVTCVTLVKMLKKEVIGKPKANRHSSCQLTR